MTQWIFSGVSYGGDTLLHCESASSSECFVNVEDWTKMEGMAATTEDCVQRVLRLQAPVSWPFAIITVITTT